MEMRLQLDDATPAPIGIVSGKGTVLNPAPCSGSRIWYRWSEFDWECDKEVILSPRSLISMPLLLQRHHPCLLYTSDAADE